MHYIRFCRPPEVTTSRSHQATVKVVLTITTDLSDAFLSPPNPIQLAIIGAYTERKDDGSTQVVPVHLTQGQGSGPPPTWRAGMRVLKLDLPLPAQLKQPIETIQIRPLSRQLTAMATSDVLPGKQGLIMAVYADMPRPDSGRALNVCFRSLRLTVGDVPVGQPFQIEEDLGESIARHVWDSGVVMVSLLSDICLGPEDGAEGVPPLQSFRSLLQSADRPLDILELGCGVGVMGIGLARVMTLRNKGYPPNILLTDLPEAAEKARANIGRQEAVLGTAAASIDFEPLDWEEGRVGKFGEKATSRTFDLITLCDCTYNTDTLPPLVATLSTLHSRSVERASPASGQHGPDVLVATKQRHTSERAFFDLMSNDGWIIRERTTLPLPMLDGQGQTVEVYLFRKER
ncbi:putative methyltransferase-domain-containing protein [Dichotomopilus funicola]|uniref:Methyltransferase-domain-containing protein n=1 Tax=Dichotomopilus funicola TaxID=1934379 RepID=A0AAN6V8N0_9PEZI|nr:putative methyltransferase-domain-containing protein [Dichotomopilus funicola]